MDKHIIFLVHGMGVYSREENGTWVPDTTLWHDAQSQVLKELFGKHSEINDGKSFDDVFEVVPIVYDHIFTNVLQAWSNRSDEILGTVTGGSLDIANKIMGWMKSGRLMEDFFYTHFGDVFLYRYFNHFEQAVQATVQAQIIARIVDPQTGNQPRWSIIGHSLGTKVTHDVIDSLYCDSEVNIGDEIKPAQLIALIANVCDVLERPDQNIVDSSVFPSTDASSNSACRYLISTSHKWDFFTRIDPYKPSGGRWTNAAEMKRFINIRNLETVDLGVEDWWNVHSLRNYLVNPNIYIPLFMRMMGKPMFMFPVDKYETLIQKFERDYSINEQFDSQFDEDVKQKRKDIRKKLRDEYNKYVKPDFKEFIEQLKSKSLPWSD